MVVNPTDAINAFKSAQALGKDFMAAPEQPKSGTFASMVNSAAKEVLESGRIAEKATAEAVAGNADVADVVMAVTNAETTLQAVVAVRDRVMAAYQEILRMPI
jgi:flagellar hook-basal body complex protein FliE